MAATGLFALHRARIARAVAHLERHLDARPATAAELAEVAGLSEFHFHRVFRAVVGESVIAHARRLRLERAARRLRGDERRIVEVALEAGFDSHEGFTRAFTGLFGVPPARYRSESPPAPAPSPPDSFARVEVRPPERALALRHVGPY
ncbi:MAG: AraC family transcriptional regulator, partial [Myxococcota bacterium]